MASPEDLHKVEPFLKIIESQEEIGGRYRDIRRIDASGGGGHYSIVFVARDKISQSRKKKEVVLKFLIPTKSSDIDARAHFDQEALLLEELKGQKNILPIIQGRTEASIPLQTNGVTIDYSLLFYASHKASKSLQNYIYDGAATYLKSIRHFRAMCNSVRRIHRAKIVHRDIKPSNFLIFEKGYLCLSDLGSAKKANSSGVPSPIYTKPRGDVAYHSPEIWAGLYFSDDLYYLSDIYALGAILFELFTKVPLSTELFSGQEMFEFLRDFAQIPQNQKREVFEGAIKGIANARQLPSVRQYDSDIPKNIARHIDELYQRLAHLDYSRREKDLEGVYTKISLCEKTIEYEMSQRVIQAKKKAIKQQKRGVVC